MIHTDSHILKGHTAPDGGVWSAEGAYCPRSTGLQAAEFVASLTGKQQHVRTLGVHENAKLIMQLYDKCCSPRHGGKLEVAGPLVCDSRRERANPEAALYRMQQCTLSPSLGGWHQVSEADIDSYEIAATMLRGMSTEKAVILAQHHPTWPDMSFIGGVQPAYLAKVLGLVIDPRWFIDPRHPERISRVQSYLGLDPYTQAHVSNRPSQVTPRQMRCLAVLRAWKQPNPPTPAEIERPEYFLWRRRRQAGEKLDCKGDLSASLAFVAYLIHTWQQTIARRSRTGQHLAMFQPDMLLQGAEIDAYRRHRERWSGAI